MKTEYPAQVPISRRSQRWLRAALLMLLTLALFVAPGGANEGAADEVVNAL